jgi:rSAM/selenodomain-associated transferase 1
VSPGNLLGLMLKFPEPGKVKTRLGKDIGPEAASSFYRQIAEHVINRTAPKETGYKRIIFYTPEKKRPEFEKWLTGETLNVQKGRDIGERMHNALEEMFEMGAEKAVVIGTDIPGLVKEIIDRAFFSLENADVVIGPAMDGGYYLIGMKSPHPELFSGITWSTEDVFKETVHRIEKNRLQFEVVDTLFDVDRLEDYLKAREILNL